MMNPYKKTFTVVLLGIGLFAQVLNKCWAASDGGEHLFQQAMKNGEMAREGFARSRLYARGWLAYADPETGLVPRKLTDAKDKDLWNVNDCAADNFPFLALATALTDREAFKGPVLNMLTTERRLTCRIDSLPDAWSFSKHGFAYDTPNLKRIIFGVCEYVKDGLLPLEELLGDGPWTARMVELTDDIWKHAPIEKPFGNMPSYSYETNGNALQALSRLYWMTGDAKYLDWAMRLGDYYLLVEPGHLPSRDEPKLSLRDHGCEIVSGLCELYATCHYARPDKQKAYKGPIHLMIDQILEKGRNEHGLFYNWFMTATGEHSTDAYRFKTLSDTWGYTLNGIYTVYLIDGTEAYRQACRKPLENLNTYYRDFFWEGTSVSGFYDAIEGAMYIYNRERIPSVEQWIDSQITFVWSKQKPDGIIEGWYGDGTFARSSLMVSLWKTQGVTIQPWREDVVFGAVANGESLYLAIRSEKAWDGKIVFDTQRHKTHLKLPLDWPRINSFPEWYTVNADKRYTVEDPVRKTKNQYSYDQMRKGIDFKCEPGREYHLIVTSN